MDAQAHPDLSAHAGSPQGNDLAPELDRIRAQLAAVSRELEESHRLAMLGTLAAGIAHEFNNLLTPALNATDIALSRPEDPDRTQDALRRSRDAISRACEVADAILSMASGDPGSPRFHVEHQAQVCPVVDAVEQAFQCLGRDLRRQAITVTTDIQSECTAAIRPVALEQVLLNLLINATKAMPRGGRLRVIARQEHRQNADSLGAQRVVIEVHDTGHGIPADRLETIFESFVSFDDADGGRGFGLGLMVCRQLIEHAGGTISVRSAVGEGTVFRIELPAASQEPIRRCA